MNFRIPGVCIGFAPELFCRGKPFPRHCCVALMLRHPAHRKISPGIAGIMLNHFLRRVLNQFPIANSPRCLAKWIPAEIVLRSMRPVRAPRSFHPAASRLKRSLCSSFFVKHDFGMQQSGGASGSNLTIAVGNSGFAVKPQSQKSAADRISRRRLTTSCILERVPRPNLKHSRLTLNLRQV